MFLKIISVLVLFVSVTAAEASGWIAERVGSGARYAVDGKTWIEIKTGEEVPNASWISTGPRGRLMLSRGEERILFKPNTLAAISTWRDRGMRTKLTQRSGAILLDVETRNRKHTSVVTPDLAAVVKGTIFEVIMDDEGTSVRVNQGVVEVRNEITGETVNVRPGELISAAKRSNAKMKREEVSRAERARGRKEMESLEATRAGGANESRSSNAGSGNAGKGGGSSGGKKK